MSSRLKTSSKQHKASHRSLPVGTILRTSERRLLDVTRTSNFIVRLTYQRCLVSERRLKNIFKTQDTPGTSSVLTLNVLKKSLGRLKDRYQKMFKRRPIDIPMVSLYFLPTGLRNIFKYWNLQEVLKALQKCVMFPWPLSIKKIKNFGTVGI